MKFTNFVVFLVLLVNVASVFSQTDSPHNKEWVAKKEKDSSAEILTEQVVPVLDIILQEVQDLHEIVAQPELQPDCKGSSPCNLNEKAVQAFQASSKCQLVPMANLTNNCTAFLFCNQTQSWHMAAKYCKTYGMNLARVDSQVVFDNLVNYLKKLIKSQGLVQVGFWVGGTDQGNEGNFYWHPTGKLFVWNKWQISEPNNLQFKEHCVELKNYPEGYPLYNPNLPIAFNDEDCPYLKRFFCQVN